MWIDTNGCEETFHQIKLADDNRVVCVHADDSECGDSEYDVADEAA